MESSEYWKKRALKLENRANDKGEALQKQLKREYSKAAKEIRQKVDSFYLRYASEQGLSYAEATKRLNSKEAREWGKTIGEYVKEIKALPDGKIKNRLIAELDMRSYASQQDRLSTLAAQIDMEVDRLFVKADKQMTDTMADILEDGYLHKSFDLQQRAGVLTQIPRLSPQAVENVLTYPWSGTDFSSRLWNHKNIMIFNLRQTLTQGTIQGQSIARMSKNLADIMGKSYITAERLIRTESNHFHAEADKSAYKAAGVTQYEYMATLDNRTSDICASLDGKIFNIEDAQTGVNYPPMHPWCRSTTVEYDPDEANGWASDGEEMPEDMSFDEWEDWQDENSIESNNSRTQETPKAKEIQNAIDFGYGEYTAEDFNNWLDHYEAHNKNVKLSDKELEIIDNYTEGGYISYNAVSRGLDDTLIKKGYSAESIAKAKNNASILEKALSKYDLDTDIVTHRFERDVSWLTGNGNGVKDLEKLIGSEYTADGFTSSGVLPNRFRFTGGKDDAVHFEIVTPKGTNGAFLSMSKKGENEFLYNRGTRFKILDGGERIVMEHKFNFKTMQMEKVAINERFLKVQAIVDDVADDIAKKASKKIADTISTKTFVAAKSVEEAETFIKQYVNDKTFGALGVSYQGVDVEVANKINKTFAKFFDTFDVDKFGGIIAPAGNTKLGKAIDRATAAYSPFTNSFIISRKSMKNLKTAEKAFAAEREALKNIIDHPERYNLDKLSKQVLKTVERAKISGRATVPTNIEEAITHELGHMLEKKVYKSPLWEDALANMPKYADKVSGYAGESKGEYIAESFASYMKGEKVADPLLIKLFESLKR